MWLQILILVLFLGLCGTLLFFEITRDRTVRVSTRDQASDIVAKNGERTQAPEVDHVVAQRARAGEVKTDTFSSLHATADTVKSAHIEADTCLVGETKAERLEGNFIVAIDSSGEVTAGDVVAESIDGAAYWGADERVQADIEHRILPASVDVPLWTAPSEPPVERQVGIPNTIHHVYGLWDNGPVPDDLAAVRNTWKGQGDMRLWTRDDVYKLIRERYPQFLDIYHTASRRCMVADLVRYLIVYTHGGWYFDMDCKRESFDVRDPRFRQMNDLVLFTELNTDDAFGPGFGQQVADQNPIRDGVPEHPVRVANYAFGAAAGHPFFHWLLKRLRIRWERSKQEASVSDYDVLFITGPDLVTTVFHERSGCFPDSLLSLEDSHRMITHLEASGWRSGIDH